MASPNMGNTGMIGLGIMGSAMSTSLLRAGFSVTGFDIADHRRQQLQDAGGRVAEDAVSVVRACQIAVTSLPSPEALLETAAKLAAGGAIDGKIVIETSTLPIAVKEQARQGLAAQGAILLDCPLSGTGAQARVKDLVVYASGDKNACGKAIPVMEGFARAHYYVGEFGAGSKMKYVANLLVAIHNVAAAEAMVLGMKAGLDPATILKVVSDGAGNSRMLEVRGPMMVKGEYSDATMKVQIWQKDMSIIGDFARKLDCPTPLLSASAGIYTAAMAMGLAAEDTAAVCAVLEKMANLKRNNTIG
jgi:L-threonate 2-dehydrogenase